MGRNRRNARKKIRRLAGGTKKFKQQEKTKKELEEKLKYEQQTMVIKIKESQELQVRKNLDKLIELEHELYNKLKSTTLDDVLTSKLVTIFPEWQHLGENKYNLGLNEIVQHPYVIYFYRFHRACDVVEYPSLFLNDEHKSNHYYIADVTIPENANVYLWADEWRTNKISLDNIRRWTTDEYDILHKSHKSHKSQIPIHSDDVNRGVYFDFGICDVVFLILVLIILYHYFS